MNDTADDIQGGDADYCFQMVRKDDPDRYLTALFAPAAHRSALFALYAFNQEVAKTRDSVSEPTLGEIRLQWWREALDGIRAGHPRAHPVVQQLGFVANDETIFGLLGALIDARSLDLYDEGPADFQALYDYVAAVGGGLSETALRLLLGQATDPSALTDDAVMCTRAAGEAFAMMGLLRASAFHIASGRSFLPRQELGGAGVSADRISEDEKDALMPVFSDMQSYVKDRLDTVRRGLRTVPAAGRAAVLPACFARFYLKRLQRLSGDPFRLAEQAPAPLWPMISLFRTAWTGRL
ncbi:phytoene/squalene synthase family protein [Eilatimonas milleporae]|uniref:Phytoene synthase n=1 Tax=Eilatimonas milleporae TaxID=911205 RepID=A0A3M0CP43_9PROT|nr:squalene/phytoene synthase family protein [Eilatimonas milleporae]RMB08649.1 phytoene synthase [Eilatimonas milleporae]